jgi:two-component system, OmpR family, response regulator
MNNKTLVYVAEDEPDIANLVASHLHEFGFTVRCFDTGHKLLQAFQQQRADICIIDLGLPDMDGLQCLRELATQSLSGLIILTGRCQPVDRILGLELGADDYISKPFAARELVARVQSLARRLQQNTHTHQRRKIAHFGNWQFDPATLLLSGQKSADTAQEKHMLSSGEANLLMSLLHSPKRILSREQLINNQTIPYDRSIDSRMSRLRKKIEQDPRNPVIIKTLYGAGYMFTCNVQWQLESVVNNAEQSAAPT